VVWPLTLDYGVANLFVSVISGGRLLL